MAAIHVAVCLFRAAPNPDVSCAVAPSVWRDVLAVTVPRLEYHGAMGLVVLKTPFCFVFCGLGVLRVVEGLA